MCLFLFIAQIVTKNLSLGFYADWEGWKNILDFFLKNEKRARASHPLQGSSKVLKNAPSSSTDLWAKYGTRGATNWPDSSPAKKVTSFDVCIPYCLSHTHVLR